MIRKSYLGGVPANSLNGAITSGASVATLVDGSAFPTTNFVIKISAGLAAEEKILCDRAGNTLTLTTRGYDGTTASAHLNGATVEHVMDAVTLDQANQWANITTGRHHIPVRSATPGVAEEIALGAANRLLGVDSAGTLLEYRRAVAADISGTSDWTSFTPSWTDLTLGTGATNFGEYRRVLGDLHVRISVTLGTGGSAGPTQVRFTLPDSASNRAGANAISGDVFLRQFSGVPAVRTAGLASVAPSGTEAVLDVASDGSAVNTNNPFTWAATDVINLYLIVPG